MNPNIFFISLFTESISSFSQSPCYSPNPSTAENIYNYKPTQRSKHFLLVYYLKYRTETPLLDLVSGCPFILQRKTFPGNWWWVLLARKHVDWRLSLEKHMGVEWGKKTWQLHFTCSSVQTFPFCRLRTQSVNCWDRQTLSLLSVKCLLNQRWEGTARPMVAVRKIANQCPGSLVLMPQKMKSLCSWISF